MGVIILSTVLSSCSQSMGTVEHMEGSNHKVDSGKNDTLIKFNRSMYRFNVGIDRVLFKPVAKSYKAITPTIINTSISNFFQNLGEVGNVFNNILQAKPKDAINDAERFIVNSTFGFAGLIDIASAADLEKHDEDFGQTLAKWGVGSGPYVMLPFLGPSTLRDATAKLSIDLLTNPVSYSEKSVHFLILDKLDQRADLLSRESIFDGISNDSYSALRDAWLQRRSYLIRDGKIDQKEQSDLIDELESLESE